MKITLLVLGLSALVSPLLHAAAIAVSFSENDTNQSWLNETDLIGPTNIPAGNFNTTNNPTGGTALPVRSGSLSAGSLLGLVDSTGAITGASVTWSSANAYWNASGTVTNQARLAVGYLDDGGNGASVTFSSIPYTTYDVYILLGSDAGNEHVSEVPLVNGSNVLAADFPAYGNLTGSGGGWIEADGTVRGNYVVARGISGPSVTINGQNVTANRIGIVGVIISDAVPEPSTALLGLASLGALALRRRK